MAAVGTGGERPREKFRKLEDVFGGAKPGGTRAQRRASPRKSRGGLEKAKAALKEKTPTSADAASEEAELLLALKNKVEQAESAAEKAQKATKDGKAKAAEGKAKAAEDKANRKPLPAAGKATTERGGRVRGGSPARAVGGGTPRKGGARAAREGRNASPASVARSRPKQSQKTPEKVRTVVPKKTVPKSRAAPAVVPPARRPRVVLKGPAALSEAARAGAAAGAAGLVAAARAKAAATASAATAAAVACDDVRHPEEAAGPTSAAVAGKRKRVSFQMPELQMPEVPVATRPRPAEASPAHTEEEGGPYRWRAPGLALVGALPLKLRFKTDFAWNCMSAFQRGCSTLKAQDAAAPRAP